ncbi:intraflagellar transport protein 20 homolog [Chironomus tepperi]|uniref:intraflagellar transport protein 20 homolog n=1 Tax=Chironomus tepperi TaxID=113505 RepID=UPI00391EF019
MAEELKKNGLYVDENHILRVLEPAIFKETQDLKEENEIFQEKLQVFRSAGSAIAKNLVLLGEVVERQKLLAINTQNLANSSAKQKEIEQQQIQTKIVEMSLELDRLKIELKYLQKCESELQEIFDNFRQNQ